jgi:hypothetical protein
MAFFTVIFSAELSGILKLPTTSMSYMGSVEVAPLICSAGFTLQVMQDEVLQFKVLDQSDFRYAPPPIARACTQAGGHTRAAEHADL